MNILILSWEYPPRIIGGLGKHVLKLSNALAKDKINVFIISRDYPRAKDFEKKDGISIHRVNNYPPRVNIRNDLISWDFQFNIKLLERAILLMNEIRHIDVIHAHDWLVAYAAIALKNIYKIPLVATIHATEYGRHQGYLPGPMQKLIHSIEKWLVHESSRTICCSEYMCAQIQEIFEIPGNKIEIIPNGIEILEDGLAIDYETFRAKYVEKDEKMIIYAGRIVYEKGIQTVIEAMPEILSKVPIKFIVAGKGPHQKELVDLVRKLQLTDKVKFIGFVSEKTLKALYRYANLAVVPSIYEPFGMVALEAMAEGTPTIVADTGGLSEIVVHEETGLKFKPKDPSSLAKAVLRILTNKTLAKRLAIDARKYLHNYYNWQDIAKKTIYVYKKVIVGD